MDRFEYKVERVMVSLAARGDVGREDKFADKLNLLGERGWDLCVASDHLLIFKRPKVWS